MYAWSRLCFWYPVDSIPLKNSEVCQTSEFFNLLSMLMPVPCRGQGCFHFLLRSAHDPPVNGQEDDGEEGPGVEDHRDRQGRIGAGEQSVQGGTEIA